MSVDCLKIRHQFLVMTRQLQTLKIKLPKMCCNLSTSHFLLHVTIFFLHLAWMEYSSLGLKTSIGWCIFFSLHIRIV